jgi:hypothetical protein
MMETIYRNCFSLAARTSSHTLPCNSSIVSMRTSTSEHGKKLIPEANTNGLELVAGNFDIGLGLVPQGYRKARWDFIFDRTVGGRRLQWLSVIDEYTRE